MTYINNVDKIFSDFYTTHTVMENTLKALEKNLPYIRDPFDVISTSKGPVAYLGNTAILPLKKSLSGHDTLALTKSIQDFAVSYHTLNMHIQNIPAFKTPTAKLFFTCENFFKVNPENSIRLHSSRKCPSGHLGRFLYRKSFNIQLEILKSKVKEAGHASSHWTQDTLKSWVITNTDPDSQGIQTRHVKAPTLTQALDVDIWLHWATQHCSTKRHIELDSPKIYADT
jgi:hypothetical protein